MYCYTTMTPVSPKPGLMTEEAYVNPMELSIISWAPGGLILHDI